MPHISVWIHFVWTTKDREPLLSESIRYRVFEHIRGNAREKNIFLGALNGWVEHVCSGSETTSIRRKSIIAAGRSMRNLMTFLCAAVSREDRAKAHGVLLAHDPTS
jgi:hypothetical protein